MLKFIYSEKATKFCEIFTLLLSYVVPVKSKMEILQNFVAFSEYMNFTDTVAYTQYRKKSCAVDQSSFSKSFLLNNFMNINGTMLFLFFLSPRVSGGPQKPQTMTASKSKYEKFGPKI